MRTIIINKVDPIDHVQFELNRINCLAGPQNSGKSTLPR